MTLDQALKELAYEHTDAELRDETISVLTWKISRLHEQIDGLERAMKSRGMIGQAIGLTMSKYGIDSDTALAFLVRLSQDCNTKLRDICAAIVADANVLNRPGESHCGGYESLHGTVVAGGQGHVGPDRGQVPA